MRRQQIDEHHPADQIAAGENRHFPRRARRPNKSKTPEEFVLRLIQPLSTWASVPKNQQHRQHQGDDRV